MAQYCVHCGAELQEEGKFCHACGKSKAAMVTSPTSTAPEASVKPEAEKTFLQNATVTVTNTRFIVPGQTYAMAGVTSVRFERIEPKRGWPVFFIIVGFLLLLIPEARPVGVVLLLIGVPWILLVKATFAVALTSASGEARAITSKDSQLISGIVDALNKAIVYRR